MWGLRVLSGANAGQVFPLKQTKVLVGRGPNCQIQFKDLEVSKEHAYITVQGDTVIVEDNGSRNGTFVNGVKIKNRQILRGDKITFNQIICDLIQFPQNAVHPSAGQSKQQNPVAAIQNQKAYTSNLNPMPSPNSYQSGTPMTGGSNPVGEFHSQHNTGVEYNSRDVGSSERESTAEMGFLQRYFEEVFLPGIYQLSKVMEFKIVIGLFMLIFAVLVTALSTIPMISITSDSIQMESRRRALTIARNMANFNQQAILKEMDTSLSTQNAELEEGVSSAYIIRQSDGAVMAPASKAGSIPSIPFIDSARREQKEVIKQLSSSQIAVAVPISGFNPDTATYSVKAFSVVVYDMGALAVDDGRTLSLFFQTLLIALILGFVLYYLFNRFVEYPISQLNRQLDSILKNQIDPIVTFEIDFPLFQELIAKINSLLSRMGTIDLNEGGIVSNKDLEIANITHLIGYAGMAFTVDQNFISVNSAAESLLGISDSNLRNQPLTLLPDQALQKSLFDLFEHAGRNPGVVAKNELEFAGENTEIQCQAVTEKGLTKYFIVTLIPMGGGS